MLVGISERRQTTMSEAYVYEAVRTPFGRYGGTLAGIRPDDLIVLLDDRLVQSCKGLASELEYIDYEEALPLTLLRDQELIEVTLRSAGAAKTLKKEQP